jgi:uncharacterized membrane protein
MNQGRAAARNRREEREMANGVNKGSLLLASAVAGLLSLAVPISTATANEPQKVACYGINKCKGMSDCSGKGHSCAGENACKGQGFVKVDRDTCLKIAGGRLTPEPKKD